MITTAPLTLQLEVSNEQTDEMFSIFYKVVLCSMQDTIQAILQDFGGSLDDSQTTLSCILVTCIQEESSNSVTNHMLILVKGDVSIASDYFYTIDGISWRISRLKCWNRTLESIINQQDQPLLLPDIAPTIALHITGNGEGSDLVLPSAANNELCYGSGPIRFLLSQNGEETAARIQIWRLNDEVTGTFEQYEVRFSLL